MMNIENIGHYERCKAFLRAIVDAQKEAGYKFNAIIPISDSGETKQIWYEQYVRRCFVTLVVNQKLTSEEMEIMNSIYQHFRKSEYGKTKKIFEGQRKF